MMGVSVRFALTAMLVFPSAMEGQPVSLVHAHAHNDYEHTRPLFDALERGFNSIEADVYLVDGQLLVAHSRDSVSAERTLESLYLEPLRAYIQQHDGRAITGPQPLILLIDVKSDSESTYAALDSVLHRYGGMLTKHSAGGVKGGPVLAVISGNRAIKTIRRASARFASIDGRLADLRAPRSATRELMPLISDSWDRITKWKGEGPAPDSVRSAIARITAAAHRHGQLVRFWATPDKEAVWRLLLDAGVDLIGADDLDALQAFLLVPRTRKQPFDGGGRTGYVGRLAARSRFAAGSPAVRTRQHPE